jgi:hypothetical protein
MVILYILRTMQVGEYDWASVSHIPGDHEGVGSPPPNTLFDILCLSTSRGSLYWGVVPLLVAYFSLCHST